MGQQRDMVPTAGGLYAMMRLADGRWEIPGGTLEPGEHWRDALRRELVEELGAELADCRVIGWFRCTSAAIHRKKRD